MKWFLFLLFFAAFAQAAPENTETTVETPGAPPERESLNEHFQATAIPQGHGTITAPATGEGFLSTNAEIATSFTSTLFVGASPWAGTETYFNPEVGAGSGLSKTQGIAAFPNGEIYRVDDPSPKAYVARLFLRQTFGLGGPQEKFNSDQNQLAAAEDISRVVVTVGKFGLPDLFDGNAYSHDARTQFLNWGIMANGAWDVASDTRGYTWAVALELNQPRWAIRAAVATVPTVANGPDFDWNLGQAQGENFELEYRYSLLGRGGKLRLLGYANHAFMGSYRETIDTPAYAMDITKSRAYRTRYGLGVNLEQEITPEIGSFVRVGWNDGLSETWDYTEMDQTFSFGANAKGSIWGRANDVLGLGLVAGGISSDHRQYLSDGGAGFILGGGLSQYSLEMVVEAFYSFSFTRYFSASADYQQIFNPGYDSARGTLTVLSARLHLEI